MTTETTETPEQQAGKVAKAFEGNLKKLEAVLKGDKSLYKRKIKGGSIESIVQDLFKEESEATWAEFKVKLKELVKRHMDFEKFKKQETQKLENLFNEKMKEFNKEAEGLYNMIDGLGDIQKSYADSLAAVSKTEEEKPQ